jgi:hypothetical protein
MNIKYDIANVYNTDKEYNKINTINTIQYNKTQGCGESHNIL